MNIDIELFQSKDNAELTSVEIIKRASYSIKRKDVTTIKDLKDVYLYVLGGNEPDLNYCVECLEAYKTMGLNMKGLDLSKTNVINEQERDQLLSYYRFMYKFFNQIIKQLKQIN